MTLLCYNSSMSKVYLFLENSLVIPDSMKDDEAFSGVDRDRADRAFGNPEYSSIRPFGLTGDPRAGTTRFPSGEPILAFLFKSDTELPSGWRLLAVRSILANLVTGAFLEPSAESESDESGRLQAGRDFLRAFHVLQWLNDSVYCGRCGEKNGDSPDELARLCPRCGRIEYPRISPAVITLVTDDSGRALLAHNDNFKNNMYSLIAGFVEAGESLEGAARREIKEELSIDIKDLRYIRSQSWPFPNSLMVGFTALYAGGEIKPDGIEIVDARWWSRETIRQCIEKVSAEKSQEQNTSMPNIPGRGSISRYIIDLWLNDK